ncbi:MAG: hypothetical protein JWO63_3465, partial [Frankiales bacterium]|nr:hypothetical protein [Frankiales bacterium]
MRELASYIDLGDRRYWYALKFSTGPVQRGIRDHN